MKYIFIPKMDLLAHAFGLLTYPISCAVWHIEKKKQMKACRQLGFDSFDALRKGAVQLTGGRFDDSLWLHHHCFLDRSGTHCYHVSQIERITLENGRPWRTKLVPDRCVCIRVKGVRRPSRFWVGEQAAAAIYARMQEECADCGNVLDRSYAPYRKSAAQPA